MIGIIIMTVTGLILGIILVSVSKEEDDDVLKCLPGLNCGTCGFGSCKGMAEAIKKDKYNYLKCRPLRGEKKEQMEKLLEIEDKTI